jgi:uridine phosphorylase
MRVQVALVGASRVFVSIGGTASMPALFLPAGAVVVTVALRVMGGRLDFGPEHQVPGVLAMRAPAPAALATAADSAGTSRCAGRLGRIGFGRG